MPRAGFRAIWLVCDDDQRGLQLEPVTQTIRKNDHVLVAFEQKGLTQYLVGIANEDEDSDGDIDVSFLRKSLKVDNKFVKPNVEDNGSVKKQNVHAILPPPVATGTTSRTKNGIVFDMDFSKIKLCFNLLDLMLTFVVSELKTCRAGRLRSATTEPVWRTGRAAYEMFVYPVSKKEGQKCLIDVSRRKSPRYIFSSVRPGVCAAESRDCQVQVSRARPVLWNDMREQRTQQEGRKEGRWGRLAVTSVCLGCACPRGQGLRSDFPPARLSCVQCVDVGRFPLGWGDRARRCTERGQVGERATIGGQTLGQDGCLRASV
ncbi:hypothetical protein EGW08_000070 [Elysia chlorotica]|uniref:Uncharacterized protein n=1 Tax=Elysia chlorotica TaxID=188477 RepID=A0A433UED3_ELYCH|nr:hypothetical protein EGW08_000070 [Elysia chlorotica]